MHRLRRKHPGKQLRILWDNVAYHYQGDMKEFLLDVNAFLEPDAWAVTCIRFAPYASEQNPIEHVWQIGKQYVRCQSSGYTTERSSAIVQKYRRHAYTHLRAPGRNRLSYVQAFIVSCAEDVWLEGEPPSWISAICSAICRPPPT